MFYVIIKNKGRLPATDSFVAKRIKGPGLSSHFYYQISVELVLLALQVFRGSMKI